MKKTLPVLLRTLPLLFLLYSAGVLQAQVFSVSELRCEQSQRPLAVDPAGPRLSWQLNADRRGCLQSAYRILVADSPVALADDNGNIDSRGLDQMDNKILGTIIHKFGGGPVGLGTVATAVSEDAGTIEEVYEPFLIKEGFLKRTPRGREATELAYSHLGVVRPDRQETLF